MPVLAGDTEAVCPAPQRPGWRWEARAHRHRAQSGFVFYKPLHLANNLPVTKTEVCDRIQAIITRLLEQKGQPPVLLAETTRFLGADIPIDSLDLAVLVTELQTTTGRDPFAAGFRNFQTVGELAALYAE